MKMIWLRYPQLRQPKPKHMMNDVIGDRIAYLHN